MAKKQDDDAKQVSYLHKKDFIKVANTQVDIFMEKASVDNLCWRLQHCNRCVNFFMFFEAMFYCRNELFTSDDLKESRKIFKIISTQAAGFKAIKPWQPISLHFIMNWCNRMHKYTNILQKVDSIEKNLFDGFINSLKESNVVDDDSR